MIILKEKGKGNWGTKQREKTRAEEEIVTIRG